MKQMQRKIEKGLPLSRFSAVLRTPGEDSRIVTYCLSDSSVDRMGDTIAVDGWELDAYLKNPVVPFGHDTSSPPVGRMVSLWRDATALYGKVEFAPPDISPFAEEVFQLVKNGFMAGGSVGFLPLEFKCSSDKKRPFGIDFTKTELLEFSVVPVPANSNALVQAQAKGLKVRALRGSFGDLSREGLARLRAWTEGEAADDPGTAARRAHALALQRSLSLPMRRTPDAEPTPSDLLRIARDYALCQRHDEADLTTREGRAHHARRLKAFYCRDDGKMIDRRHTAAEGRWRCAPRW